MLILIPTLILALALNLNLQPAAAQGYQLGPQVLTKLPPFQLSAEGELRNGAPNAPASLQARPRWVSILTLYSEP